MATGAPFTLVDLARRTDPTGDAADVAELLSQANEIICCNLTRFVAGKKIEGVSCRLSCDMPAAARGRKPAGVEVDSGARP